VACNAGPITFESGLPLDWILDVQAGGGPGWVQSSEFADPVFCQANVTGAAGKAACAADVLAESNPGFSEIVAPVSFDGFSDAALHFEVNFQPGAPNDVLS